MSTLSARAALRIGACVSVSGFLLFFSTTALAASAGTIEEVVVTAQRTEQTLQEVPIAVSAFTGQMMEDRQIITASDLQLNTPNVSYTAANFGGASMSIRGIGRLVVAGSGENGVSIHQNQIALPTNLPSVEFYDVERVEILRGPQGTLFGRNATGGAVNMVTRMPDFDSWNGHFDIEGGDYSHKRLKGALNIPIADNFAIRVAGMWLERDGYIKNTAFGQVGDCLVPGSTIDNPQTQPCSLSGIDDDIDGRKYNAYRATALWQINDNARAWLLYSYFKQDDDMVRITNQVCERNDLPTVGCTPDGFGFDTPHLGSTTGGIFGGLNGASLLGQAVPDQAFAPPSRGFRKMHTDFEPVHKYNEEFWTAGFDYDFERYRVGLLAGYQKSDYVSMQDYLMDVGGNLYATAANPTGLWPTSRPAEFRAGADWLSPVCNYNDGTSGIFGGCVHPSDQTRVFAYDMAASDSKYWTTEIKVESDYDGALNFLVGANYSEARAHGDYYVVANTLDLVGTYGVPLLGFPPLYPTMFDSTSNPSGRSGVESDASSIFGEIYYDITPDIKLTAGLRYNRDKKRVSDAGVLYNSLDLGALGFPFNLVYGPQTWFRTALAPLLDPGNIGTPAAADATALAEFYGVYDAYLGALGQGDYFGAVSALQQGVPYAPGFNENRILTGSPSSTKFTETTGRIGIDWQVNDQTMVYGFFTRGYKPGGFNPPLNQDFVQSTIVKYVFEPEQVDSFEIGAKNVFLDGSLVVNASAFIYDYKGLQTTRIVNNNSINDNIDADIYGLELEMFYRPRAIPGLSIDLAYSHLKAEVDGTSSVDPLDRTGGNPDFITLKNIDPGSLTGVNYVARQSEITPGLIQAAYDACGALSSDNANPGCPPVAPGTTYPNGIPAYFSRNFLESLGVETSDGFDTDIDGNSLPNSPEHTIYLGLAYTWNIDQIAGSLTARWDYYWQSKSYAREFNTRGDKIDSWDQHNASLIYESANGLWQAKLWVRNIKDDDNVTGKYLTSDTSGFFRNYFLTEPRIYGLSVRYAFDNMR
jgi:iron complex outermembrane recepter protein